MINCGVVDSISSAGQGATLHSTPGTKDFFSLHTYFSSLHFIDELSDAQRDKMTFLRLYRDSLVDSKSESLSFLFFSY